MRHCKPCRASRMCSCHGLHVLLARGSFKPVMASADPLLAPTPVLHFEFLLALRAGLPAALALVHQLVMTRRRRWRKAGTNRKAR